jgi:transcriptional regulator with XRE-family HTH domain
MLAVSYGGMDPREKKRAKPTKADLDAARRLRARWDEKRKEVGLTQEDIAKDWPGKPEGATQGLVSQYLRGEIPLGYIALLHFAKKLKCAPEDIRDDLPEQQHLHAANSWPFETFNAEQFLSLTEKEKGMVEWAAYTALQRITGETQPSEESGNVPEERRGLHRRRGRTPTV